MRGYLGDGNGDKRWVRSLSLALFSSIFSVAEKGTRCVVSSHGIEGGIECSDLSFDRWGMERLGVCLQ